MMYKEQFFTILRSAHISEKSSILNEKHDTIVFKVSKNATKSEIKEAIYNTFEVKVANVRTLIIKGKVKRHKNKIGRRSDWKKAYITLKKGEKLDFFNGVK